MTDPSKLGDDAAREIADLLLSAESTLDVLQSLAELAGRILDRSMTCGITLVQEGHVITVASADARAQQLDEQQYVLDQGPCLQAIDTGEIVVCDDLSREERWDGYPTRALSYGISSVYSSPLTVRGLALGALNMYAPQVSPWNSAARDSVASFVSLTTAVLAAVLRNFDEDELSDHLRNALFSRSIIDQALGIVMASEHCGEREAFRLLRAVSQTRNVRLRDVAGELVARTSQQDPPMGN